MTVFTITAATNEPGDGCTHLTFNLRMASDRAALLWCRTAMMQLGYKPERVTLTVDAEVREPRVFSVGQVQA